MLVLSRFRDQVIEIDVGGPKPIEVTVVDIRGDKVKLGITADKAYSVHRREVAESIRRENRTAAQERQ